MKGQPGLSELSVISWVSAFQGCPLKRGSTVYACSSVCMKYVILNLTRSGSIKVEHFPSYNLTQSYSIVALLYEEPLRFNVHGMLTEITFFKAFTRHLKFSQQFLNPVV